MSWDEAVAEANAASPPDAPILKIRARAADSILGSASSETAGQDSGRRWPFLFERLLRFGPRAALAASLVGFMGVAGAYFSGGQLPFSARTPQPTSLDGQQPGGERSVGDLVDLLRVSQPAMSKHLKVLRDAGLVEARVDAQRRLYRIQVEPLRAIDDWLAPYRALWESSLDALEQHLDQMEQPAQAAPRRRRSST